MTPMSLSGRMHDYHSPKSGTSQTLGPHVRWCGGLRHSEMAGEGGKGVQVRRCA